MMETTAPETTPTVSVQHLALRLPEARTGTMRSST